MLELRHKECSHKARLLSTRLSVESSAILLEYVAIFKSIFDESYLILTTTLDFI